MAAEAALLRALTNLLNHLKATNKLTYKRINTVGIPYRGPSGVIKGFRKNSAAGLGDLLIFLNSKPLPVTIQIELKAKGKYQSPGQKEWQCELEKVGHGELYFVVRTMDGAEEVLRRFISW